MTWTPFNRINAVTDAEVVARLAEVMVGRTTHPEKRDAYRRLASSFHARASEARAESRHDRNF